MFQPDGRILKVLSRSRATWGKGSYEQENSFLVKWSQKEPTCWCLAGMVRQFYSGQTWDVMNLLADKIEELFPTRITQYGDDSEEGIIVDFNDHKETTYEDVLQVVQACGV